MSKTHLDYALTSFDVETELQKAKVITSLTFEQLGYPNLIDVTDVSFNNRFQNKAGDAHFVRMSVGNGWDGKFKTKYDSKIRLSTKYFATASEDDKMETVVHEACHIAHRYLQYIDDVWLAKTIHSDKKTAGHGIGWHTMMEKVGYPNANRFHCLDVTAFKNYYMFKCPNCGNAGKISTQLGGRIINYTSDKSCSRCRTRIKPSYLTKVRGADLVYTEI